MPQQYLHNWRQQPQGVEYVDPGEDIQAACTRSRLIVLTEGQHSTTGLTLRDGQWLTGVGETTELVIRGAINLGNDCVVSDFKARIVGAYGANGYAFRAVSKSNITIRQLTLDGSIADQTWTMSDNGQIGLGFQDCETVDVLDCRITGFSKDCVYFQGGGGYTVANCLLQNFSRGGVTSVDVTGLDVYANTFEDGRDLPVVIGNNGVWLEPDNGSAVFRDITIRGCLFRNLNRGVLLYNTQEVDNTIIESYNIYRDCRYNGVLWYYGNATQSYGSAFISCGLGTSGSGLTDSDSALAVFNTTNSQMQDHKFSACGGSQATVMVGPNCRGSYVRRCTFVNDQKRAIYAYYVFGSVTKRAFTHNRCENGSLASAGTYAAIHLEGTAGHPIDADAVEYNEIDVAAYSGAVSQAHVDASRIGPNYNIATAATL